MGITAYHTDYGDADDSKTLRPCWLDEPRGFVDRASKSAEELNDFLSTHLSFAVESWAVSQRRWMFRFKRLLVELIHDLGKPLCVNAASDCISRRLLDALRAELRAILQTAIRERVWSMAGFGVMLLQMTEEGERCLLQWEMSKPLTRKVIVAGRMERGRVTEDDSSDESDDDDGPTKNIQACEGNQGWVAASVSSWASVLANDVGVNLLTVEDTAKHLLGQSIGDICSYFPDCMRILHVEPVFRDDLVLRFLARQQEIYEELSQLSYAQLRKCISGKDIHARRIRDTRLGLAEGLSRPSVTFHGAPRRVVSSIVRYGFIMPGEKVGNTGQKLDIRCGASYGVGIYSSSDPFFASCYSEYSNSNRYGAVRPSDIPGMRLIVCATLMGRPVRVEYGEARRKEGLFVKEGHSHVSPGGCEHIVFSPAQIIPCYVLHVDYGAEEAKEEFWKAPNNPRDYTRDARKQTVFSNDDDGPGARQARKQALKAAAAKWFPYGYGPATGTSFVIEEIGEVSDDEEEYGEFQALRNEHEHEIQEGKADGSWFDEYQTVRTSNKEVRRRA